jgi:hypothetical protein
MPRKQEIMAWKGAMELYLSLVEESSENGIVPRCHLEDIISANFFWFCSAIFTKTYGNF